jgi:hypothetical protein
MERREHRKHSSEFGFFDMNAMHDRSLLRFEAREIRYQHPAPGSRSFHMQLTTEVMPGDQLQASSGARVSIERYREIGL